MVSSLVLLLFTCCEELQTHSLARLWFFTTREKKSYVRTNHEVISIMPYHNITNHTCLFQVHTEYKGKLHQLKASEWGVYVIQRKHLTWGVSPPPPPPPFRTNNSTHFRKCGSRIILRSGRQHDNNKTFGFQTDKCFHQSILQRQLFENLYLGLLADGLSRSSFHLCIASA